MNCVNWAKLTLLYPHRLARGGHIAWAVDPDPHSFCLLNPDPGWKNEKCEKMQENWLNQQVYTIFKK